jgi:hypothetical protein
MDVVSIFHTMRQDVTSYQVRVSGEYADSQLHVLGGA